MTENLWYGETPIAPALFRLSIYCSSLLELAVPQFILISKINPSSHKLFGPFNQLNLTLIKCSYLKYNHLQTQKVKTSPTHKIIHKT